MGGSVRFGGYELRALLGKGGMAQVYRAVRMGPHGFAKEVALKVLDPNATATQGQIDQLTDEARLGGLLRHPNIVATDELGQVGPFYYIAMELVDGWPLDRLLNMHRDREEPIPPRVVLDLMVELCKGLDYVHTLTDRAGDPLKLVHRDMKPANVMVGRGGQVKIMDFGIAKATTNLYTTQEQSTRGTPLFMSPEQVAGGEMDGRSDIFSVGSMMQELATLTKTFAGQELIPILRAVLEVDIEGATERLKEAFPGLLPVFLRCMQADPADRYPNANALRTDLEALREQQPQGESLRDWLGSVGPHLPRVEDGDLGDMLPGVIIVRDPNLGANDTISMPMQSVADVPSQFQMPLGPSAGPATGKPTTSEASLSRLNFEQAWPEGPPAMPRFMASGSFIKVEPAPPGETEEPQPNFVKPGRPLAPSLRDVRRAQSPPEKAAVAPTDMAAVPKLPPSHPLFRHNTADRGDLPAVRAPAELPKARPGARPKSVPASVIPQDPNAELARALSRPQPSQSRRSGPVESERQAGDSLPNRRGLLPSLIRISVALGVFAALIYSYSHVPGPVGDIARSIMDATHTVLALFKPGGEG
ncbi:MAG: protein kinase [Deltaproteobacteria bacterium]|nr:protein kinase [Deltaproteobacteria bacterium]